MAVNYSYFSWEGKPCRVAMEGEIHGAAEMYRPGEGFVEAPFSQLLSDGRSISRSEFDKMVLEASKAARAKDSW